MPPRLARHRLPLALAVLLAVAAGCAGTRPAAAPGDTISTTDELVDYLGREGLSTQPVGLASLPILSISGEEYRTAGGETLQVYTYDDEQAARADAGRVAAEKSGPSRAPHFYQRGRFLVVYFGDDPAVELTLSDLFGNELI